MQAKEAFQIGDRVRMSIVQLGIYRGRVRGARTGTVVGYGRRWLDTVRVLRDGQRTPVTSLAVYWELDV